MLRHSVQRRVKERFVHTGAINRLGSVECEPLFFGNPPRVCRVSQETRLTAGHLNVYKLHVLSFEAQTDWTYPVDRAPHGGSEGKLILKQSSRRDFLKLSASSFAFAGAGSSVLVPLTTDRTIPSASGSAQDGGDPLSDIAVWHTDAERRFAPGSPIRWQAASAATGGDSIRLVLANKFQTILGFGGCFSDAACYQISQLEPPAREKLLHDLFHPTAMGLSVCRTCVGAADSAASLYSYDEGDEDPELKRFTIDHDRAYILPLLRQVRKINPDLFLFAAPWSPPGWMKWNKSMLGGSMNRKYLSAYANYLAKFLQGYAAEGVPVQAITAQNEIDTDQHGQMPACTWSQECETEFIVEHLGPLLEKLNSPTQIWILDHNYVYWGRVISELDNPDFRRYAKSVAWHGYVGEPEMMSKVISAHPDVEMHFTEGSTDYNDPHYQDDWTKWGTIYSAVLTNWCRSAIAWNIATDENGKPNIGPYPCGGILIINSHKQQVTYSGQYWALAHFSRSMKRGARRFESQCQASNLKHLAVENPDGEKVLVLTNAGPARTVEVCQGLRSALVLLLDNSMATLVWK
jgi:glucosylceramidase